MKTARTFPRTARTGVCAAFICVAVLALLACVPAQAAHTIRIVAGPSGDPNPVASEGAVKCSVQAVDSEDRDLKYTWSCDAGEFDDAHAASPTWTAPANTTDQDARYTIQVLVTTEPKGLEAILGAPVARGEFAVTVKPAPREPEVTLPDLQTNSDWILLSFNEDNEKMQIEPRADMQCIAAAVVNRGQAPAVDVTVRFSVSRFGRAPIQIGEPVALGNLAPGDAAIATVMWDMQGRQAELRTITVEATTGDGRDANPTDNSAAITANIFFAMSDGRPFSWSGDTYGFGNFELETGELAQMVSGLLAQVAQERNLAPQTQSLLIELLWPTTFTTLSNYFTRSADKGAGGHSMGMSAAVEQYFSAQRRLPAGTGVNDVHLRDALPGIDEAQTAQLPWLLTTLLHRGNYMEETLTPDATLTIVRSLLRDQGRCAMVRLLGDGWGHSALAYKLIEIEGRDPVVYVYDPNAPASNQIKSHRVMPQITLSEEGWSTPAFMGYENSGARYIGAHAVFAGMSSRDAEAIVRPLRRLLYGWAAESAASGKMLVSLIGPADLLMTSGRDKRLGVVNERTVNDFQNAEVLSEGGVEIYSVPPRENFSVEIRATGTGQVHFSVLRGESETRAAVVAFSGLTVTPGTTATCALHGDGTVENFTLDGTPVQPTTQGVLTAGNATVWGTERNSPPSMPKVTITPAEPTTDDDLICSARGSRDADGDEVQYRFQWYRNGKIRELATSPRIAAKFTQQGDVWRCIVTPSDGKDDGPAGEATVIIGAVEPTPRDWQVVGSQEPEYTLSIPGDWYEDTGAEGVLRKFYKSGNQRVFVELRYNEVPDGLTSAQFEALAVGYMQQVPYLQTRTNRQVVAVPDGVGVEFEFTGTLANEPIRALVRHVKMGTEYFELIGVTDVATQDDNWPVVRQI
ncbi:MAG: hypothetical protein J7M38_14105, partial [Armatimonadetes bacterium]|nr:hypothetical protein [Armatimonadota bacterium]